MGRTIRTLQTSFTAGELDPLLAGRTDHKGYYAGAERLRNVLVVPQGGVRRRPGLRFVDTLSANGTIAVRLIPFEFSTTQRYLMVVTGGNLAVYKDGVRQAELTIPHTAGQLRELSWTQSLDTLFLFHPDVQPRKIVRQGSHTSWSIAAVSFQNVPTYSFERDTTSTGTPAAKTGTTTFTAGGNEFSSGDVGRFIRGNAGYAEITSYSSPTSVGIKVLTDFYDTKAIVAGSWSIEEPAWSDARGWPGCGTFHQGRLILAHTRQRPQTVWGSRTGLFFDFDITKTLDDYGFELTADSDTVSAVYNVYSGRHLSAFTSDSEWYIPVSGEALTPKNVSLKRATRRGSERGLPVAEVDGGVMFVQRFGKAVREWLWADPEQDYTSQNISLLSSHLINAPVDLALRKSTNTEEADLLLVANGDGTLAVLCTLRDQNITAWSQCATAGKFGAVGVDGDAMYFAVERVIDGCTKVFLERFDNDCLMDCGRRVTTGMPLDSVANLAHLNGATVAVRADDAARADAVVAGGAVALAWPAETSVECGLDFPALTEGDGRVLSTPLIRTMPVEPALPEGTAVGKMKRIVSATVRFHETQGARIGREAVSFFAGFDRAPAIFSGNKTVEGMLGYDTLGQVEIVQDYPAPLTVLGIAMRVAV